MTGKTAITSSLEDRAIALLASGINATRAAEALGVSVSRISQLMEETNFKEQLAEAKFAHLNRHNEADKKLDDLEATLVNKLADSVQLIAFDPMKLARVFQVVNSAKRRGTAALGDLPEHASIVNLNMPTKILNNTFVTNINNQVIQAGGEDLVTLQPHRMEELVNEYLATENEHIASAPYPSDLAAETSK